MARHKKGRETRQRIIQAVSHLYNEYGLTLTLDQIAQALGLSKGRITNYFPKKEQLLLAIYLDYDGQADQLYRRFQNEEALLDFSSMVNYYQELMDLQYRYRFALAYLAVQPLDEPDLQQHIADRYARNKAYLEKRIAYQVRSGSLTSDLLNVDNFEAFSFQLYNLLTTWVVSLRLYHPLSGYRNMKPVFLRGIMHCFLPYLTDQGKTELEAALRQGAATGP